MARSYTIVRCDTCGRAIVREVPRDFDEAHCRKCGGFDAPQWYRDMMREHTAPGCAEPWTTQTLEQAIRGR